MRSMGNLPEKFLERLNQIIPDQNRDEVLNSFGIKKKVSARVNTLKINRKEIHALLKKEEIPFERVPWNQDALIFQDKDHSRIRFLINEGLIYIQNLSSMLVPLLLDPKEGESVLDLCAAPGSKTTQMSAMMNNAGSIVAIEHVKARSYKLRSVIKMCDAQNISVKLTDGRKYKPHGQYFDKILIDAPCSSEGRFRLDRPKTMRYWSLRKIREMRKKQRGLLLNASRLLKPGGVMVYSTCTFSPEENEGVVDWFLRKTKGEYSVSSFNLDQVRTYAPLLHWRNKSFDHQVNHCIRILPDRYMDAFFIAKIERT